MNQTPTGHYVYVLTDPRTNIPFYVGKGTAYRYKAHESEARHYKHVNDAKCDIIRDIWDSGHNVEYELIKCESHEAAFDAERALIIKHGRLVDGSGTLTNIDRGGRDRWRPKTSNKLVYQYDRDGRLVQTFETARLAAAFFNCDPSVITKVAARSKLFRDICVLSYEEQTPESVELCIRRSRPAKRRVAQYTMNGVLVGVHDSAYEAGRVGGLREDGVYTTLRDFDIGKRKTTVYGGFSWKWVD